MIHEKLLIDKEVISHIIYKFQEKYLKKTLQFQYSDFSNISRDFYPETGPATPYVPAPETGRPQDPDRNPGS